MKKKKLKKLNIPILTLSLAASMIPANVNAAEALTTCSLKSSVSQETVSDIVFTCYNADLTYSGEETTSGLVVKASYDDESEYDMIDTDTVLTAYQEFVGNDDNNVTAEDVKGIIITSDEVEITQPIDFDYVEIDADNILYGEYGAADDDEEETDSSREAVTVTSKAVSLNGSTVLLVNQYEDVWNCGLVDIYGSQIALISNPFTGCVYNIVGTTDELNLTAESTVAETVKIDFTQESSDGTFSPTTISLNGSAFDETYKLNTEVVNYINITLDTQGGSFTKEDATGTLNVVENGYINDFPEVEKEGYTLAGWFSEAKGGSQIFSEQSASDDIYITSFDEETTVYAQWTPNKYNVTLKFDDGTTENHADVEYDSAIDFFPDLTNEDPAIVLKGWKDASVEDAPLLKSGDNFTYAYNVTLSPVWEDTHCDHEETITVNEKEASCSETGYTGDKQCTNCENIIEFGEVIPKTAHPGKELKNQKTASCTQTGYTGDYVCTECGDVITEGTLLPKTSHTLNEGVVSKQPTKDEEGQKTYTCAVCGKKIYTVLSKLDAEGNTHETTSSSEESNTQEEQKTDIVTQVVNTTETSTGTTETDTTAQIKNVKSVKAKISKCVNKKGKKIQITLKKVSGYKYQIQVSTSKKFKKTKKYSTSKTSYTVKKLKKGKKYYVRVRLYKKVNGKNVYGKWSKVKSVKIKK